MKSQIVLEEKVENKDRKFGSNAEYFPCMIGEEKALFTKNQLEIAINRAKINEEDFAKATL